MVTSNTRDWVPVSFMLHGHTIYTHVHISQATHLHLREYHRTDFLRSEQFLLSLDVQLHVRLVVLLCNFEGEVLYVVLHRRVVPRSADKSLRVENGVLGIGGQLVFGGISNEPLAFGGEGNIRWGDTVTLIVGNYFHSAVLVYSDAKIRKTKCNVLLRHSM